MPGAATLLALSLFVGTGSASGADPCPRIISQSPFITHTLEYLGLEHCIVGASRYDPAYPDTGGVYDPDGDAIRDLNPDLALTSSWMEPEAWSAIVPDEAQALVLGGFEGMEGVVASVRRVALGAGLPDADARAARFDREWRGAAEAVPARSERVLLLSSCSGQGYAYGANTWLHDAFSAAGFKVVAPDSGVTHLVFDEARDDLAELIDAHGVERVFAFNRDAAESCRAIVAKRPFRVVSLPADLFQHPAPVIADGLRLLTQEASTWQ